LAAFGVGCVVVDVARRGLEAPVSFWSFFRSQEPDDEPFVFDTADDSDPVGAHFRSAQEALIGLLPPSPLKPPAARLWREIEADLAMDPEFMRPVFEVLRDYPS
jgi:hypothetical protein